MKLDISTTNEAFRLASAHRLLISDLVNSRATLTADAFRGASVDMRAYESLSAAWVKAKRPMPSGEFVAAVIARGVGQDADIYTDAWLIAHDWIAERLSNQKVDT